MNLNEISIWVGKVFDGLYIGWPYKTALGIVFLALERHFELFTAFACIVCVESMTEEPSLARGMIAHITQLSMRWQKLKKKTKESRVKKKEPEYVSSR